MKNLACERGKSFPLGATLVPGGANFSVFAKHSTAVQLLLFDGADAANPSRVIDLDPRTNRTYHYWHAFVPGVTAGQIYGYRVAGPFDLARGLRFDPLNCAGIEVILDVVLQPHHRGQPRRSHHLLPRIGKRNLSHPC